MIDERFKIYSERIKEREREREGRREQIIK